MRFIIAFTIIIIIIKITSQGVSYLDFLHGVTAYRVSQVLLSVLKPAVESGRLLGEEEEQILNLTVLLLRSQKTLATVVGIRQQLLPPKEN